MIIESRCIKYGDNINTDVIIPARYLNTGSHSELAAHCMEDLDSGFHSRLSDSTIIVAGRNFGCGSSREHAPIALKASGIGLVIASSFARIFYRNAINIGLPILECPQLADESNDGDMLRFDSDKGEIIDITSAKLYSVEPFPEFIGKIISAGGLMNYAAALKKAP